MRNSQLLIFAPKPESRSAVLLNQAAYIEGWLAKLRSDKRMVVIAAAQAQKAPITS